MKKLMARSVASSLVVGLALFASGGALASYPDRPIELVIPFGPGGATDISARSLATPLGNLSSQPIILSNRTGAGGATGSMSVKNADADGYTMLVARVGSHTVNPAMNPELPYSLDDFRFVGVYEINPVSCVVRSDSSIQSIEDLVTAVNEQPGTQRFTSSGVGSMPHMASLMVLDGFGAESPQHRAIHLPMEGGGAAVTAVLQGDATFICENSSVVAPYVADGRLRPLMVTSPEPLEGFDAPTVAELGVPELEQLVGWTGIAGPADIDDEVAETWRGWLQEAVLDEEFRRVLEDAGSLINLMSPEESLDFVRSQYETFRDLVIELDIGL